MSGIKGAVIFRTYLSGFFRMIVFGETVNSKPFNASCPQKGHTYLNKPASKSCRFV